MTDLAGFVAMVRYDLGDAGSAVWLTDAEIQRAIRQALHEYSRFLPRWLDGSYTVVTAGRRQPLASFTGLQSVLRVWFPYYATEQDLAPTWVRFEQWPAGYVFLPDGDSPAVGDVLRVFYTMLHTIDDLDSATATTVPSEDEELVCAGAAGFAAQQKAVSTVGVVNVSGYTPLHWRGLASAFLVQFRAALRAAGNLATVEWSGPVQTVS